VNRDGAKRRTSRWGEPAGRPLLGIVVTAILLLHVRGAEGERCTPHAQLSGDGAAVERVGTELLRLGVLVGAAAPGCPSVEAAVELDHGGIAVAVRDGSQRSEGRVVGDATIAAAWIDSWLHDDLEPWRTPAVAAESPAIATHATITAPATGWLDRLSMTADVEESWTLDGSSWRGVSVAACAKLGAVCLGGRARYASQSITANQTAADRSDMSVLATASTTLRVGSMRITPELGLGVGRLETTRIEGCVQMPANMCDPTTDPTCPMQPGPACTVTNGTAQPTYVGDHFDVATYTPRAAAALRVGLPLVSRVWLEVLGSATAAPFGHSDPFGGSAPPNTPTGAIALPGEPTLSFQVGVGLRIEAP
jgi:hypothetical protein